MNDIIDDLRKLLFLFKQSETFAVSKYAKNIVCGVEIAVLLLEFAERNKSKIRESDKYWFKGGYQVTREFEEEEWRNIGLLYNKLVEIAEKDYW